MTSKTFYKILLCPAVICSFIVAPARAQGYASRLYMKNRTTYSEMNRAEHPFTPELIARAGELTAQRLGRTASLNSATNMRLKANIRGAIISGGAAGIDQGGHGDCWFESALAALARIPEGQQLICKMIVRKSNATYIVKFPGVKQYITVSTRETIQDKTRDMTLWARILEVAAIKGWPNLITKEKQQDSPYFGKVPILSMGLKILTGSEAECIDIAKCPQNTLAQILQDSFHRHQPMTAATYNTEVRARMPQVVIPNHAYTVISYDPLKNVITLRNPWGRNATPNNRSEFRDLPEIGQEISGVYDMGGGLIAMTLPIFVQHFHHIARASL